MKDLTSAAEIKTRIYKYIQSLPTDGLDIHHTEALCLLVDALMEIRELSAYISRSDSYIADINRQVLEITDIVKELSKHKDDSIG